MSNNTHVHMGFIAFYRHKNPWEVSLERIHANPCESPSTSWDDHLKSSYAHCMYHSYPQYMDKSLELILYIYICIYIIHYLYIYSMHPTAHFLLVNFPFFWAETQPPSPASRRTVAIGAAAPGGRPALRALRRDAAGGARRGAEPAARGAGERPEGMAALGWYSYLREIYHPWDAKNIRRLKGDSVFSYGDSLLAKSCEIGITKRMKPFLKPYDRKKTLWKTT